MDTMFWIWLVVIAVALIIEIITLDLVSIWFSVGAVIPFILSAIGGVAVEIQILIFVVVSALLIIFLRKYAQKLLFKNMNTKTNIDALTGKRYKLIDGIAFEKNGSIKINDVVWTAVSENGEEIEGDSIVEIVKVEGNKMIVRKIDDTKSSIEPVISNKNEEQNIQNDKDISQKTEETDKEVK